MLGDNMPPLELWPDGLGKSMSLPREMLQKYLNPAFIETGTCEGGGVLLAREVGFQIIHSIEIDSERYRYCVKRLSGLEGVFLYEGDTVEILPEILSKLEQKATIWIDAHPLGQEVRPVSGKYRYPLTQELELISKFSKRRDHTILVDDRHAFQEYQTDDDGVMKRIKEINPNYRTFIEKNMVVGVA